MNSSLLFYYNKDIMLEILLSLPVQDIVKFPSLCKDLCNKNIFHSDILWLRIINRDFELSIKDINKYKEMRKNQTMRTHSSNTSTNKINLNNEICSSNRYYYSYLRITLQERINLDSLYAACANENLDIVHILLNKGISPYNMRPTGITTGVPTLFGPTVFDHPLIYKNMKLLKLLLKEDYINNNNNYEKLNNYISEYDNRLMNAIILTMSVVNIYHSEKEGSNLTKYVLESEQFSFIYDDVNFENEKDVNMYRIIKQALSGLLKNDI